MKRIALILIAAVLSCGFLIDTPAAREEQERLHREWAKIVSTRYDLVALTSFLKKTVKEKKSWKGVDLTKPTIGAWWRMGRSVMTSGDWEFSARDPKKNEFTLSFIYEDGKRELTIQCVREENRSFRVLDISSDEVVVLTP